MIYFFWKILGMPGVSGQQYPKGTSIQKVSGTGTASFLEYPCFIGMTIYGGSKIWGRRRALDFDFSQHYT